MGSRSTPIATPPKRGFLNFLQIVTAGTSSEVTPAPIHKLELISQKTKLAEAIRYALSRWVGLTRFIDDGRIEIDSNVIERSIRPIALNRKNTLFAGSDGGGEHWAIIASLIETCKLNGIDPQAYLTDVITRIVNDHPNSRIDALLPWAYAGLFVAESPSGALTRVIAAPR